MRGLRIPWRSASRRPPSLLAAAEPVVLSVLWTLGTGIAVALVAFVCAAVWARRLRRSMEERAAAHAQAVASMAQDLDRQRARADSLEKVVEQEASRTHALDRRRRWLLAGLVPEMLTPLSVVRGVLDGDLNGEVVERARSSVDHMTSVLEGLADLADLEGGTRMLRKESVDVTGLLQGLIRTSEAAAEARGVRLRFVTAGDSVWALVDAEAVRKAIGPLLLGVVRHTGAGEEVRVVHESTAEGDVLVLLGDDDGGGPSQVWDAISGRGAAAQGGAPVDWQGVGLAFASELIALQGGDVHLDASGGGESRLVVRFPEAAVDAEEADQSEAEGRERGGVLIVDDHADVRMLLRAQLRDDYRVVEASNGTAALDTARRERPDLVITDLMMPGRDGISVIAEMRGDPALDDVPLLVISAHHNMEADAYRAGADAFVPKPWSREVIVAQARALVDGRRALQDKYRTQVVLPDGGVVESDDAAFVRRLAEAIGSRLDDPRFGVAELADEMAMSRQHLAREVRRVLDTTPSEVLLRHRMERGAALLKGGVRRVSEVASAVGVASVDRFTRQFRSHFGVTPSEYRDAEAGR